MRTKSAAAIMIGMLALAGCGTGEVSDPVEATDPTPAATGTTQPDAGPGIPTAPDSCLALDASPGAELEGEPLNTCVADALRGYGSGRMQILDGGIDGTVDGEAEFTYDPDYAVHGEFVATGQQVEMTYLDGEMWIDSGRGWIKGDPESMNPEEMLIGKTAQLYQVLADPRFTADLIANSPVWNVADELETRTLPDGTELETLRIESAAPFSWGELPVTEYILWYTPEWVPVGAQATTRMMGIAGTGGQLFYDLGADITIEPVE